MTSKNMRGSFDLNTIEQWDMFLVHLLQYRVLYNKQWMFSDHLLQWFRSWKRFGREFAGTILLVLIASKNPSENVCVTNVKRGAVTEMLTL